MQRNQPSGTTHGARAHACRAGAFGFQTAHRGETAAAWLVSCALVAAISLFAAEVLFQGRVLF